MSISLSVQSISVCLSLRPSVRPPLSITSQPLPIYHPPLYLSLHLSLCPSISLSIQSAPYLCPPLVLINPPLYLSVHPSIYPVNFSIHLSSSLFIHPPLYLSVHFSICLSTHCKPSVCFGKRRSGRGWERTTWSESKPSVFSDTSFHFIWVTSDNLTSFCCTKCFFPPSSIFISVCPHFPFPSFYFSSDQSLHPFLSIAFTRTLAHTHTHTQWWRLIKCVWRWLASCCYFFCLSDWSRRFCKHGRGWTLTRTPSALLFPSEGLESAIPFLSSITVFLPFSRPVIHFSPHFPYIQTINLSSVPVWVFQKCNLGFIGCFLHYITVAWALTPRAVALCAQK